MTLIDLKPVRRCGECFHLIPADMKNCPYCRGDVKAKPSAPQETPKDDGMKFEMKPLSPEAKKRLLKGLAAIAAVVVVVLLWQFIANAMVLNKSILEPLDESVVASKTEENFEFNRFYYEVSELREYIKSDEDKEKYEDISYKDFLAYYNSYSSSVYCNEVKQKASESYDQEMMAPMQTRIDSVKTYWTKYIDEHDVNKYITLNTKTGINSEDNPIFYFNVQFPKGKLSACSATLLYRNYWGMQSTYDMNLKDLVENNSEEKSFKFNWRDSYYWNNHEITIRINSVTLEKDGRTITADEMDNVPGIVNTFLTDDSEYNKVALVRELIDSNFPSREEYAHNAILDDLKEKNATLFELINRVEQAAGHTIIQRGFDSY